MDGRWPAAGSVVSLRFPELEPPELVPLSASPEYPVSLLSKGIRGTVVSAAIIDTTGRADPASIRIVTASESAFGTAMERFLKQARWRPGRYHGRPMRVCVVIPMEFSAR